MTTTNLPCPASVLPHRDSLLLLTGVSSCGPQSLTGQGCVDSGSRLATADWVPSIVAVEMAAQGAAYHASLPGFLEGQEGDEKGFLVRVRDVKISQQKLPVGEPVDLTVDLVGRAGGLALYSFLASVGGQVLAKGTLSILRG